MEMSEIPEDILAKAETVYDVLETTSPHYQGSQAERLDIRVIARAIMEERERCARIAGEYGTPNRFSVPDVWRDEQSPSEVYDIAAQDVSLWIETAIRDLGGNDE
jgi:hypothetical protein